MFYKVQRRDNRVGAIGYMVMYRKWYSLFWKPLLYWYSVDDGWKQCEYTFNTKIEANNFIKRLKGKIPRTLKEY